MNNLIERDLSHIWHPCSQMKDFERCPPFIVNEAKGSYLYTNRGPLIDAISSWWCKSLGHGHPEILSAITRQMNRFEHVIGANTTHEGIVELGEMLAEITGNQRLFFASDGSCAVEIALKMALQANQIKGMHHKNQFVSLKNSYHGETIATLSVSDVGLYKAPFEQYGLDCHFIEPVPYVKSQNDAEWHQCDKAWNQVLSQLEPIKDTICAVIIEPILQGAGGMLCYSADFLKKLSLYCEYNDIYLISDEIMTGFGRTGEWLALDHAGVKADMVCLSKGLTSGTLPLSVVCIDDGLYQLFYDDYETGKAFMHSHTYSGNATAISAAIATLKIMKRDSIHLSAKELGHTMLNEFTHIANETGKLSNIRQIGAMVAGDLEPIEGRRVGFELYQEALTQGAYLRPLGNTLYWMPPLNTSKIIIGNLAEITLNSIKGIYL